MRFSAKGDGAAGVVERLRAVLAPWRSPPRSLVLLY
jgi:hypothetical protein